MRKWLPLTAVCLGTFMLLVDVTIVTVALPDMARSLHTSFADLQWVMDIYALALAALLLSAGSLADLAGRRKVYLAGLVLFAVASLACGLATGPAVLIAFRALQGIGGAAMSATTMALLSSSYQGKDRGIAFGVWGAVSGAAAAAGPVLGGMLTQHLDWHWIFYVNLPVSALAVLMTLRYVSESRNPHAKGVDLPGMATFTLAAGAVTYALIRVGDNGWTSTATLGFFALGALALAAFVAVERRSSRPMLDLALFRSPSFVGIMLGGLLLSVAGFSYMVYASLWLQSVRGMGPVTAGLVFLPMSIAAFLVSAVAGRWLYGASPRWTIGIGMLLISAGALLQAMVGAGSTWTVLLPGLALTGVGVGLAGPLLAITAMASVPTERGGMAAGAANTSRQLGNALGIAVLGAVFQDKVLAALRASAGALSDPKATADALTGGRAAAVIARTAPEHRAAVSQLVHEVFAAGLRQTFLVAGVMGLVGGAIVLLLVRRPPAPAWAGDAGKGGPQEARPSVKPQAQEATSG
ncbi:EmrB/QacA subfamily drug resistance transporter [Kitasatospora sp. MAP12-15]|uniref:MFS transporter n=1 Tax=unclassified Kitasatospora TaxID=2633591 RepID=UPI002476FDF8|nr:MFS transporter [Kitasatospora sp. MAP12-44]MDH6111274.1 EmrB/QacA subfamily drug resistance transporter [Kitasatospora sp. MAP12-44]